MYHLGKLLAAAGMLGATSAMAADLEVTHWWTSGGEAAAVSQFAKALNEKTDHNWIDGAIAGSGGTARPIIISRILGGDPMAATQLNHGRQAEELIQAGLMTDLTEIAAYVLNDAELAAVSARYDPGPRRPSRTLVVTIGFGVGAALLESDQLSAVSAQLTDVP